MKSAMSNPEWPGFAADGISEPTGWPVVLDRDEQSTIAGGSDDGGNLERTQNGNVEYIDLQLFLFEQSNGSLNFLQHRSTGNNGATSIRRLLQTRRPDGRFGFWDQVVGTTVTAEAQVSATRLPHYLSK